MSLVLAGMIYYSILKIMKEATLIYPHQLYENHPALAPGRPVYLIEEPLLLTEFPIHRQKLLFHRLSLQAYKTRLEVAGYQVNYLDVRIFPSTNKIFTHLAQAGISHLFFCDPTDNWLEKRINTASLKYNFSLTSFESPLFILTKADAMERYLKSGRHLARFYKTLRQDKNILINDDGSPVGGAWSFDNENRQKLPKNFPLLPDPEFYDNDAVTEAKTWLTKIKSEQYGEALVWLPYTHETAHVWLRDFFKERFSVFGTYEDALKFNKLRLFHSTLSPLLNCGLLSPQLVLNEALSFASVHNIATNNIEGFVRQILGWREFIRASYELDGNKMREQNFWKHHRSLPASFWDASTQIPPIDDCIRKALAFGYNHHIERLMVLGNFMLLTQIHPDEVYRWFMAMYVDAYDWVMVPNVYGMSQFADGGSFATKPYISGSNYLKKISDYNKGDWEDIWTALYWNFIATHESFFLHNHRLTMMPSLLRKMEPEKRLKYLTTATIYLNPGE